MRITKLLVANRGEIAIRVMRAAAEMGIRTVAVYAHEDRFALHRFKADESYLVGEGLGPLAAYLCIEDIVHIARKAGVDAVHPGYGFLSENPKFAEACTRAGIAFVGPDVGVLEAFGDKVRAREAAQAAGVPVLPASGVLPADPKAAGRLVAEIGYPVMLKASWGGGGRGMRVVESADELEKQLESARRESAAAFGSDEVYVEKLVQQARHVEVQVLGDRHGNLVHLFERDCTVQRRNQKLVERAPAPYLTAVQRGALCDAALALCRQVGYTHAGTVEFLMDAEAGAFYFIEVNPRLQVEHTVTEEVTGVDIVKSQIRVTEGARIGAAGSGLPAQADIRLNGHALQCRVTTEDPENGFAPDHGRLTAYRSPSGFGVRLDGGTAYSGAVITPYYDSLLVKVTAWAPTAAESIRRMDRALREFRIRGLSTNLQFLENVIAHASFEGGNYTTHFVDTTEALFEFVPRRDRATRLLRFIGNVIVNGHPEMKGRATPAEPVPTPRLPGSEPSGPVPPGLRDQLRARGSADFAKWMRNHDRVLLTDTTMRDAHQSLFATRMRTRDLLAVAPHYAHLLPGLLSLECWGGATFDVALRFLKEDPFARLALLRERIPNIPLQMLLRSSNAVGYTHYPDNVVQFFIRQAAQAGVDIFRIFDCLNGVENMRLAIDTVLEAGGVAEAAICYTGDLFDPSRPKYDLKYYVGLARQMEKAGAQVLGIKDMAGVCRPRAARELVRALREEVGLPIHFHTHDTSGIAAASVLAAVEAGVDAVDGALDAMSGLTSQPNLGSIAAALVGGDRDPGINLDAMQSVSDYWEGVRRHYAPFESDIRSGTADVYRHEMPGGQYTNLREQARAMGIDHRWPEVSKAYADVNRLFGDIIKVTPSSKVVGDMALYMVTNDLRPAQVEDPAHDLDFPASVVSFFRGELGEPPGGFPKALQKKVLKGASPIRGRPGAALEPVDLDAARADAVQEAGRELSDPEFAAQLMYPKVFQDYAEHEREYGDVSVLPTDVFFHGMHEFQEIAVEIDVGKTLVIRLLGRAEGQSDGVVRVFFELNGQPRTIRIARADGPAIAGRDKAQVDHPDQVGAPIPGMVVRVNAKAGQAVKKGDALLALEAMKMETVVSAPRAGRVKRVCAEVGDAVESKDLLVELEPG